MRNTLSTALIVLVLCCSSLSSEETKLPELVDFVPVEVYPELIAPCAPEYPDSAVRAGLEGKVWLKVLVNDSGLVDSVEIARSSSHPILDQAAEKAAHGCRFSPAQQFNRSAAIWIAFPYIFSLDTSDAR